jgi:uncharacterized protein YutE (UPF0331/DUF86 family)
MFNGQEDAAVRRTEYPRPGRQPLSADEVARREADFQATDEAEDFRYFEEMVLRERAARPYGDAVSRYRALLDTYLSRLQPFAHVSVEDYAADWMTQCVVERTLELAIHVSIALARRVIAERQLHTPTSYADTFAIARDADLIPVPLASSLMRMCGFRNRLAHAESPLDAVMVLDILHNHLADLEAFTKVVEGWTAG